MCCCVMAARKAGQAHSDASLEKSHNFVWHQVLACNRHLRCLQHTARGRELDFWLCCVMGAASCHSAALNWVMGQTQLESVMRLVQRMRRQSSALDVRCTQCDNDIGMAPEKI